MKLWEDTFDHTLSRRCSNACTSDLKAFFVNDCLTTSSWRTHDREPSSVTHEWIHGHFTNSPTVCLFTTLVINSSIGVNAYRVPKRELALSGGGKTRRHQHVAITDKCQLGRFTFSGVTLTHLSDRQTGRQTHTHTHTYVHSSTCSVNNSFDLRDGWDGIRWPGVSRRSWCLIDVNK